jgi:hypothetical protein
MINLELRKVKYSESIKQRDAKILAKQTNIYLFRFHVIIVSNVIILSKTLEPKPQHHNPNMEI